MRSRPARADEIEAAVDALDLEPRPRPRLWRRGRAIPAPYELAGAVTATGLAPPLADLLVAREAPATTARVAQVER